MTRSKIHFVTGKLAADALRETADRLATAADFAYSIQVLPITVAALMTAEWMGPRVHIPSGTTRVILPGYCRGDLKDLETAWKVPVERGPRDLRALPDFFGQSGAGAADYGGFDIEIIAEINHAPQLPRDQVLELATAMSQDGANVIDVGCTPGETWSGLGECVRALRDAGHRVSIDSLNTVEIASAVEAGAELVLSVNSTNRHAAAEWGCEVVAIPDVPSTPGTLDATLEVLDARGVPHRIDPVLEPIGFGFAASLARYQEVRRRYPQAEIMMGIGNLTELTDGDSAGINVLLMGFCQEVGIRSVLTTQVINWARSSVRECDLARRLVFHAVQQRVLPKHLEPQLVMLRDTRLYEPTAGELTQLANSIRDHNYRLFVRDGQLHLVSDKLHLSERDPFVLFQTLMDQRGAGMTASHAFYLGYEMAKAATALTLGKQYRQDEALDWGFLTEPETSHRLARTAASRSEGGIRS